MTTYRLPGFFVTQNPDGQDVDRGYSQIYIVVEDQVQSFSTELNFVRDPNEVVVNLVIDSYFTELPEGPYSDAATRDFIMYQASWSDPASGRTDQGIYAVFEVPGRQQEHIFRLSGDAFPEFATLTELSVFLDGVTTVRPEDGSGFQPGDDIWFYTIPGLISTENDDLTGSPVGDVLRSGLGADTVEGAGGDDTLFGGDGNDLLIGSAGNDVLHGDAGTEDAAVFETASSDTALRYIDGVLSLRNFERDDPQAYEDQLFDVEFLIFSDGRFAVSDLVPGVTLQAFAAGQALEGQHGHDRLVGLEGADTLTGNHGRDTLIGGEGDDVLNGGGDPSDLRDDIFGGEGDDLIDGGAGNDMLRGDAGADTVLGGAGADTVIGGAGNDVLSGQSLGDLLVGGDGDDFLNGGFGSDRMNGGTGADRFFHLGIAGHGSDWIQDYSQGDVLVFGGNARADQFQVNRANTANAGAGEVDEAFIIYRPTGQILWALVDGAGQDQIQLRVGQETFDLLA